MNKLLLLIFVLVSFLSCNKSGPLDEKHSDCSGSSCPMQIDAGNSTIDDVIQEDNWKFTLSGEGWTPIKTADEIVKVAFHNQSKDCLVFFIKEESQQTLPEYVIANMKNIREAKATIKSAKTIALDNKSFVLLSATTTENNVWVWITVQNGIGYSFSCVDSSLNNEAASFNSCNNIANTVHIL